MTDLAQQLRLGTQQAHTTAENSLFMKCFLNGVVIRSAFQRLLCNLYGVYSALEEAMIAHQEDPIVGPMVFPELWRRENLAADLAFYFGQTWQTDWPSQVTDTGQAYVSRIHQIAQENPALVVAHSYVRYLGDLSGGQGLRAIARKALDLPPDQGTGLHDFDRLPTPEAKQAFKQRYRDALNGLPVSSELAQALVLEAQRAFHLNCAVMASLDGDVVLAIDPVLLQQVQRENRPGSTEAQAASAVHASLAQGAA